MSASSTNTVAGDDKPMRELAAARQALQNAQFADAESIATQLAAQQLTREQNIEARYLLAVARRYRRNFAAARSAIDDLLAVAPQYARAWQERGHICLTLNQPGEATRAFDRAVGLNPGLVASWKALAQLSVRAGDERRAEFATSQADYLDRQPREVATVIDLVHEGRLAKAETLCRRYLRDHPRHIEAMRLLADIGMRLGVYDDAEFLLESCVQFAPDNLRARSDYLKILNRKGKFADARRQAETLVAAQPENPAWRLALANALCGVGLLDDGIAGYRACLDAAQDKARVHVLLGHALKTRGDLPDAIDAYRAACRERPAYGDAWWSLANTKTYLFDDTDVQAMHHEESAADADDDDRVHFCFAAGKAHEDRTEYRQSFEYYERGNRLRRQQNGYDAARTSAMVDAQIEVCTPELFERRRDAGCDDRAPVFIVGLPRAGSTLLEQILASHSMVDGTMELHNVLGLAQRLGGRSAEPDSNYPRILGELDDDYFARFGQQYIDNTRVYRGAAERFTDKMPNNFLHIGLIQLILPNAKIIDARRQPMACCFSVFKQLFGEGQQFSYGLDLLGAYYRDYVRLMEHWDRVLPGRVLRVRYEDVTDDLESQVRRILEYCELPFEPACLEFHRTVRSVRTPSSEQVRQPIYKSGNEQWRHFESWLTPLADALGHEVLATHEAGTDPA